MKKGIRAGETPIGVDVVEGKSYYWCTCGKSSKQPFCDGSHTGSEFGPLTYKAEQSKKVFFVLANKLMISHYVMVHITLNKKII